MDRAFKKDDFLDAIVHGDAWDAFVIACENDKQPPYSHQQRWRWFLLGWKAKGKQHSDFRKRRP